MSLTEALKLLDAAGTVFASAVKAAQDLRATLPEADRTVLDARLAALQSRNDADFRRIDLKLQTAAEDATAGQDMARSGQIKI